MIEWSCLFSRKRFLALSSCIVCIITLVTMSRVGAEVSANSNEEIAVEKKGLFWKAEFTNGHAYLLGSVHFANSRFYPLASQITEAFEQSDVIMVEMDEQTVPVQKQQEFILSMAMYPPGETIQHHLSPRTLKLIIAEMEKLGMSLPAIERFRPGFLMMTAAAMQSINLGYTPEFGIDQYFLKKARGNKKILQIESFQEQIALLGSLPENDDAIYDTFTRMPANGELWQAMERAWQIGDKDAIYKLAIADPLKESPESMDFYDKLFFKRNLKMADAVERCVTEHGQCFVIVGAGHLVGPESVIDLLRSQGANVRFM